MTAEITRLLGLDVDQFNRTVVLPQGRFADFLHANPADRQATLRQLLGFDIYRRIAVAARQRAAIARNQVDALRPDLDEASIELSDECRDALVHRHHELVAARTAFIEDCTVIAELDRELASIRQRLAEATGDLTLLAAVRGPEGLARLDEQITAAEADVVGAAERLADCQRRRRRADEQAAAGPDLTTCRLQLRLYDQLAAAADEHAAAAKDLVELEERRIAVVALAAGSSPPSRHWTTPPAPPWPASEPPAPPSMTVRIRPASSTGSRCAPAGRRPWTPSTPLSVPQPRRVRQSILRPPQRPTPMRRRPSTAPAATSCSSGWVSPASPTSSPSVSRARCACRRSTPHRCTTPMPSWASPWPRWPRRSRHADDALRRLREVERRAAELTAEEAAQRRGACCARGRAARRARRRDAASAAGGGGAAAHRADGGRRRGSAGEAAAAAHRQDGDNVRLLAAAETATADAARGRAVEAAERARVDGLRAELVDAPPPAEVQQSRRPPSGSSPSSERSSPSCTRRSSPTALQLTLGTPSPAPRSLLVSGCPRRATALAGWVLPHCSANGWRPSGRRSWRGRPIARPS